MKTILTYHSDRNFKRDFVKMTKLHREQERYISGVYCQGQNDSFRGCSIGCSIQSLKLLGRNGMSYNDHAACAKSLGWPEWLCHLQDIFFEKLPIADRVIFTEQLAEAIPVGVDINPVKLEFCAFLIRENIERVLALTLDEKLKEPVVASMRGVLTVIESAIKTGNVDESSAESARSALSSAEIALISAEIALSSAEIALSSAKIALSALSSAFIRYKDELLKLLKETK